MRSLVIPGGWEADSRPDGQYAAAIWHGSYLATDWGSLPNPPADAPRWPVLATDGRIACQGQNDPPKGWEWDGIVWTRLEPPCGVWPVIYGHDDALHISSCQPGVGSQGWRYVAPDGRLVTGDETVLARQGLNEWTDLSLAQDGSCLVGQDNGGAGVGVWAAGEARRLLTPGACYNVRAKWDGLVSVSCYNVAPDGVETRIFWLTMAELETLPVIAPPPVPVVTFQFTHPVLLTPFKAAGSGCADVFTLGTYVEGQPPAPLPDGRLLLAHDSPADWTIPAGALRSYDLVLWELYRVKGETLAQSAARWDRQTRANLAQWPGDCGVIPMCYTQFQWTVSEVLDGLRFLSQIVNLSPRLKVIAPFAYDRANGIVSSPDLLAMFGNFVAAATRAGSAILTPVPKPPVPPRPVPERYQTIRAY